MAPLLEACAFPNVDLHLNCLLLLRNMAPTPPTVRVVHAEQTKKCAKKFAASGASPPDRHRCTPQTCTAETATCRSSATIRGVGRSLTEGNRRKNINFHAFTRGLSLSLLSRVGKQQLSTHGYCDSPWSVRRVSGSPHRKQFLYSGLPKIFGTFHTAMLNHWSSVLLSLPMFSATNFSPQLKMPATDAFNSHV